MKQTIFNNYSNSLNIRKQMFIPFRGSVTKYYLIEELHILGYNVV
jgi:hypothetical protein